MPLCKMDTICQEASQFSPFYGVLIHGKQSWLWTLGLESEILKDEYLCYPLSRHSTHQGSISRGLGGGNSPPPHCHPNNTNQINK